MGGAAEGTTVARLGDMATTSARPTTHPRLIPRIRQTATDEATIDGPVGWSSSDTLFVLLLVAAVTICALVPLALL